MKTRLIPGLLMGAVLLAWQPAVASEPAPGQQVLQHAGLVGDVADS
jgi:hypothetical protein